MIRTALSSEQPRVNTETLRATARVETTGIKPSVSPLELNAAETAERTKMIAGKWKAIAETGISKNPEWGAVRGESALDMRNNAGVRGESGPLEAARAEMRGLLMKVHGMGFRPGAQETTGAYLERIAKEMGSTIPEKQLVDRSETMWKALGNQITIRGNLNPIPTAEGFLTQKILPGNEATQAGKEFLQVQRVIKGIYTNTGVVPARGEDVQAYAERAIRVQLQKTPTLHADMLLASKVSAPAPAVSVGDSGEQMRPLSSAIERLPRGSAGRSLEQIQADIAPGAGQKSIVESQSVALPPNEVELARQDPPPPEPLKPGERPVRGYWRNNVFRPHILYKDATPEELYNWPRHRPQPVPVTENDAQKAFGASGEQKRLLAEAAKKIVGRYPTADELRSLESHEVQADQILRRQLLDAMKEKPLSTIEVDVASGTVRDPISGMLKYGVRTPIKEVSVSTPHSGGVRTSVTVDGKVVSSTRSTQTPSIGAKIVDGGRSMETGGKRLPLAPNSSVTVNQNIDTAKGTIVGVDLTKK